MDANSKTTKAMDKSITRVMDRIGYDTLAYRRRLAAAQNGNKGALCDLLAELGLWDEAEVQEFADEVNGNIEETSPVVCDLEPMGENDEDIGFYFVESYPEGVLITAADTYSEALKKIAKFEDDDKKAGSYADGAYAVHQSGSGGEGIRIHDAANTLKMLKQARHEDAVRRGAVKSERKAASARENGKKGGRPRKK